MTPRTKNSTSRFINFNYFHLHYNQWANAPIDRFEIYLSDTGPITSLVGLTPFATARGGDSSIALSGLAPDTDHFFVVVPVDPLGNSDPAFNYGAAYVLSPEVISRELSLHVGQESTPRYREVVSREFDILVPDALAPAPVTGLDSGFAVNTSTTDFGAVSLDFTSYNETAQLDVIGYDVYLGTSFFDDVTGLTPFAQLPAGNLNPTLTGLPGGVVRHFAVVATDSLGNFDPVVRSFSALTSISGVGEVVNLAAVSSADSLSFTWEAPTDAGAFLTAYRLFFDGQIIDTPIDQFAFLATELTPATGYPFRIATVDIFGNESAGLSLAAATLLPNPDDLFLTAQDGNLVLFWTPTEPSGLVSFYEIYQSSSPISDLTGLTPTAVSFSATAILGSLESLNGQHFAVAAVNTLNAKDNAVTSVQASKQSQSIAFPTIDSNGAQASLSAIASSGLPVQFEYSPTLAADLEGNLLTARQGGTVNVLALQGGDDQFWPASATQSVRFLPVITSFTSNGVPLANGQRILQEEVTLAVSALDLDGISTAEFLIKANGESSYTSLSVDNTPTNGLTAILPVASYPEGLYDLQVNVTTPSSFSNSTSVSIELAPQPILSLALDEMIPEGESLSGTVSIGRAKGSDLEVTLASSQPGQLSAGPPVVIASGSTSAPFTIQAVGDEIPEALLAVTITATAPDSVSTSETVNIIDDDIPVLTLTLDRSAVLESTGEQAAIATLTRDRISPEPLGIDLSNSNPTRVAIPSEILFPGGDESVSFPIATIDNNLVDGTAQASFQASLSLLGSVAASSNEAILEIGDDEGPVLELIASPNWILEGTSQDLLLRRNGTAGNLTVQLESTDATRLLPPVSIVIPDGASEVTVTVDALDDGLANEPALITLTASTASYAPGLANLLVAEEALPDLQVTSVSAPTLLETESEFTLSYTVANTGAAALEDDFTQRIFLSTDTSFDSRDILLQQDIIDLQLAPGEDIIRELTLRAPQKVASYYFLVTTDAPGEIPEFFESNNTGVTTDPADIVPAYSAMVEVSETVSPTNQLIVLNGSATQRDGFSPAAFVQVNLHLRNEAGLTRIISAITESDGTFAAPWAPLPNEGGRIEIGATHPGVDGFEVQDSFTILALEAQGIPTEALRFDAGSSQSFSITISNPSDLPLTNLATNLGALPAGLTVTLTPSNTTIAPNGSITLLVEVAADGSFSGSEQVPVEITTDEGVNYELEFGVNVSALVAQLIVEPRELRCSVLRGSQKNPEFTIRNVGGIETGPIAIALPSLEFLSLATASPLPSLAPGASQAVTLSLTPRADIPLTLYEGSLAVAPANGPTASVSYAFRTVSDLTGSLAVDVVDEFYYFAEGSPKVEGATVTVLDAITAEEIQSITTASDGLANFDNLLEGWYTVNVVTPDHDEWKGNVFINADETTNRQVFISKQLVTYTWTVEETEIIDRYRIDVETIFETNVPAPVVTVSPSRLDVDDLTVLGQSKVVNFIIENKGLINAETGRFNFGSHPFYEITPLIADVGTLPAKTSLVVPVTITRVGEFDENGDITSLKSAAAKSKDFAKKAEKAGSVPCSMSGGYRYTYKCGPNEVEKGAPVAVSGVEGRCGGRGRADVTGGGTGGGIFARAISFTSRSFCDCPPFFGSDRCVEVSGGVSLPGVVGKITSALGKVLPAGIKIDTVDFSLNGEGKLCVCCKDGCYDVFVTGSASINVKVELFWGIGVSAPPLPEGFQVAGFKNISASASARLGVTGTVEGSIKIERKKECKGEGEFCISGSLSGTIEGGPKGEGSASATSIDTGITYTGKATARYTAIGSANVTAQWCSESGGSIKACASAEISGELGASLEAKDSEGNSLSASIDIPIPDILPKQEICTGGKGKVKVFHIAANKSKGGKAETEPDPLANAEPEEIDFSDVTTRNSDLINLPEVQDLLPENADGVCARVKVKISQEAVTTRSAFRATLEIKNNLPADPLTEVGFDLDVRDIFNQPAGDRFNVRVTKLTGLAAIDGTGTIAADSSGAAQWTLIPRDTAAPTSDAVYVIGGTIRYNQGGVLLSVPVEPTPITVHPDAALALKYFHQRDVISDDPFTDNLELPEPYYLAVQVANDGFGAARNLSITSAQPEIVENEKGLLIDFKINSTAVEGMPADPTLQANFGEIAPSGRKTAVWEMESSLQGLFIDYKATFEHLDGFDDPRISLLKNVEIHEMIRLVEAGGDKFDGRPDFLTNDVADLRDFPDTIHLSDGSVENVTALESASVTGIGPAFTVTIPPQAGWTYLRIPDPGNGNFTLQSIVRSDGEVIPVDRNAWLSDRTFIGLGQRPRLENFLHLVDCDSTGVYNLQFSPVSNTDEDLPESSLQILPGTLGEEIALNWSGTDVGTGIDFYDIYVSVDNGPFTNWLAGTRRTSALYPGVDGTNYAFYSIATDRAGNVEPTPAQPDAALLLNANNQAPVLAAIADQSITEGQTLAFRVTASDPDGPRAGLIYSVTSPSPSLVIDSQTGALNYVSGEGEGGRIFTATVTVTDSGTPASSASQSFQITVNQVNTPPTISPIATQTITSDGVLLVDAEANDNDVPTQTLTWSLGSGAPTNMSIDPESGLISWAPGNNFADQTLVIPVIVTDSGVPAESTSANLVVQVLPRNDRAPAFNQIPVAIWTQGRSFSLNVLASDFDSDPVTLAANLSQVPGASFADEGDGSGELTWNTGATTSGSYFIPVTASANGATTGGMIEIQIKEDNVYWNWAVDEIGNSFDDPAEAANLLTDANPDGDEMTNLMEMALLTNPLVPDKPQLELSNYQRQGPFGQIDLRIYRRKGSQDFVRLRPMRNDNLTGEWQSIPIPDWSANVDADGDEDERPETEAIDFSIFELYPDENPPKGFFRIEATPTNQSP